MKNFYNQFFFFLVLISSGKQYAQHHSKMAVVLDPIDKVLHINQKLTFYNQTNNTLTTIVLNDWNNAYSTKNTPLAKRFSDEFYRGFHLAKEEERGGATDLIISINEQRILYQRTEKNPDYIILQLQKPLIPLQKITISLSYKSKIPSDKFTKYGYHSNGEFTLKHWFLTPARYEANHFIKNSNFNLDDIANAITEFEIDLKLPASLVAVSDLECIKPAEINGFKNYHLFGNNRTDFNLTIQPKSNFSSYHSISLEVVTNLEDTNLNDLQKATIIDRVVAFTNNLIGDYSQKKIIVSQINYERNPFYGLNQLPSFLRPFPDEFIYEIKFLKTYLNEFLKSSLHLDPRKDNWIYDGIQVYIMMKYIDEHYPNTKMIGNASKIKLLKSYNLAKIDFNAQYSYFYMLMARRNLDQPLGSSKNSLIKFNEQIASKYRAGLSMRFLDNYLGDAIVQKSFQQFYQENKENQVYATTFSSILKKNALKNINWFFNSIINSRDLIDYKFSEVSKSKDSITFSMINKSGVLIPIPIYGLKKGKITFKQWLDIEDSDSTFTIARGDVDKLVLNLKNEVPEYNLRNNWKKLNGFFPNNRPIKFVFMKDLEDPYYNQIVYIPSIGYNLYDGITPGLRLNNRTILEKPFIFDVNPSYSTKSNNLSGSAIFVVSQNYRDKTLYNIRYSISGSFFHYAENATYLRLNPLIQLRIRQPNFRDNRKQLISLRQIIVNREQSRFTTDDSPLHYSVFDARYINTQTEVTNHFNFISNIQIAEKFGKIIGELEYRKLFEDNRQLSLRLYTGAFLFNKMQSDYFSFALDRPTDYLFDYNYLGRSENSGIFSQQYITAEGGFKSKIASAFANRWITSVNASYSIWNWIEAYGDVAIIKNEFSSERFLFDSGIRLNLVPDYFELYFPVYSSKGLEIEQKNYEQKIRFTLTISPKMLVNLFNRKWF